MGRNPSHYAVPLRRINGQPLCTVCLYKRIVIYHGCVRGTCYFYDTKWAYFPHHWSIVGRNYWSLWKKCFFCAWDFFLHVMQWYRASIVSLLLYWMSLWTNSRVTSDRGPLKPIWRRLNVVVWGLKSDKSQFEIFKTKLAKVFICLETLKIFSIIDVGLKSIN